MKKFTISFFVIVCSIGYILLQNTQSRNTDYAAANPAVPSTDVLPTSDKNNSIVPLPVSNPVIPSVSLPVFIPKVVPTPPLPPAPKPRGQYVDGTYTGGGADAYYGTVQVQISVKNGKLADVQFLQYPNDRGHSISINQYAMPILRSEAIQNQTANVRFVSGATDTSMAFQQSLGDALAQAKS